MDINILQISNSDCSVMQQSVNIGHEEVHMSYIEFQNVKKIYKMGDVKIKALNGADFSIEKGEFAVIAGASGAGKSTILNLMGGMDTATTGKIIVDKENVSKIECIKTKSESRNQSPKNIEGSNFVLDIDYVLFATGARPDKEIVSKFEQNEKGYILVNEDMQTSIPNVYAGGDVAGERATVAWAARSGRNAANKILENLTQD